MDELLWGKKRHEHKYDEGFLSLLSSIHKEDDIKL